MSSFETVMIHTCYILLILFIYPLDKWSPLAVVLAVLVVLITLHTLMFVVACFDVC